MMFSWELQNYINERNGILNREEFVKVVNLVDNPQIIDVVPVKNVFKIVTSDGYEIFLRSE